MYREKTRKKFVYVYILHRAVDDDDGRLICTEGKRANCQLWTYEGRRQCILAGDIVSD